MIYFYIIYEHCVRACMCARARERARALTSVYVKSYNAIFSLVSLASHFQLQLPDNVNVKSYRIQFGHNEITITDTITHYVSRELRNRARNNVYISATRSYVARNNS